MRVHKNENIRPFDCDDTLILENTEENSDIPGRRVDVWDPVKKRFLRFIAHEPMIRLLEEEKHRGAHIVVWSRGGWEWASCVVKALDLTKLVDDVMTKPIVYFDDTPVKKWLKDRVYLSPYKAYKR